MGKVTPGSNSNIPTPPQDIPTHQQSVYTTAKTIRHNILIPCTNVISTIMRGHSGHESPPNIPNERPMTVAENLMAQNIHPYGFKEKAGPVAPTLANRDIVQIDP